MALRFIWTDGNNEDFRRFCDITEQYYNRIAGGAGNRLEDAIYYAKEL